MMVCKGEVFTQIMVATRKEIEYNRTKNHSLHLLIMKVVKDLARTDGKLYLESIFQKKASFKRNYFDTFAKLYRDIIPEMHL